MPRQHVIEYRAITPALAEVIALLGDHRTFPEIAEILGVSHAAVRDRVERAKSIADREVGQMTLTSTAEGTGVAYVIGAEFRSCSWYCATANP